MELSKLWVAAGGLLVGAIAGAGIWANRAAGITAQKAAGAGEDDALIQTAANQGTSALGAALQGAFWGGVIGLILAVAYLYFSDPEREGFRIRKVDTGDENW